MVQYLDETTDTFNKEQVDICLMVDNKSEAHEDFMGLFHVDSTQESVPLCHDVLQRTDISITKLRGQCYGVESGMGSLKEQSTLIVMVIPSI